MEARNPLAVVTPTLDGYVLATLTRADEAFTPAGIQRMLPTGSVEGVRRTLGRLERQGIVTATQAGRAVMYRLNRDHVAADAIIALTHLPARVHQRIENTLTAWTHPPTYGAVYGSWARGQATDESDVDLFLVRPPQAPDDAWQDQVIDLGDKIVRWTGNRPSIFVRDEEDVISAGDSALLRAIRDEGLTVCGSTTWLRRTIAAQRLEARR